MSTISSYDDALDFLPAPAARKVKRGGSFLAKLRILLDALAEGNAAASRYHELTARGKSANEAASQVFAEFYGVR